MKRLLTMLLILSLSLLLGCTETPEVKSSGISTPGTAVQEESDPEAEDVIRDDYFEGMQGTYEWVRTVHIEDVDGEFGTESRLVHVLRYTNITNLAVIPHEAIRNEMVLQHENEIELNDLMFQALFLTTIDPRYEKNPINEWAMENTQLVENAYKNIKPGATVEFAMHTSVKKDMIQFIYLKNRMQTSSDRVVYEKKISISNQ